MIPPRLSIGLPVYNGENYLAESIDSLLDQSFADFELIISDNASTDNTPDICRYYEQKDLAYRMVPAAAKRRAGREPQLRGRPRPWGILQVGLSRRPIRPRPAWALRRCARRVPGRRAAHSWTARIDGSGAMTRKVDYSLRTASVRAPERFRSILFDVQGDDDGGVIRTDVLRRVAKKNSYHHADHTIIAELALHGRFYQVEEWLYFRRDHPDRAERACPTMRSRCVNMDPRRANRLRHPVVRLYGEYVWAYMDTIRRAPLQSAERRECYGYLAQWLGSRFISRPEELY